MKLTETAISKFKERTREAKAMKLTIALALNFTVNWVDSCLKANKDNGPLTTEKALQIIERSTGLGRTEILEETKEEARA